MAKHSDALVRLIGAFKLTKAAVLVALGAVGLLASPRQVGSFAEQALAWMGVFPGREGLARPLARLLSLNARTERTLAVFCLAYAAVFLVEGVGLLRRKRWAEWLTVVVTTSFIPIEVYEMVEHFGPGKVVTLVLNVAIVVYLIWRRVEERRGLGSRLRQALRAT